MFVKSHISIGAAAGLAVGATVAAPATATGAAAVSGLLLAGAMGGALPDALDAPSNRARAMFGAGPIPRKKIQRMMRRQAALAPVGIVLLILNALLTTFLDFTKSILPHRGPSHWLVSSLLAMAAFGVLGAGGYWVLSRVDGLRLGPLNVIYGTQWLIAFGAGYALHILADSCTVSGVKMLMPVSGKRVHLLPKPMRFKYDNPIQFVYVVGAWVVGILIFALGAGIGG